MNIETQQIAKRIIPTLHQGKQFYANYTEEDFMVWKILFMRQMSELSHAACADFLKGVEAVSFHSESIPDFETLNSILAGSTGWQIVAVPGIVDDALFFELLAEKKFPATTWLRTLQQLDYIEEPDMFHDVLAHIPLLTNPEFSSFLQSLGKTGLKFIHNAEAIHMVSRAYWYTVEFGLIREKGEVKIYGAGILSSVGETNFSLHEKGIHQPFDIIKIMETDYRKDTFQSTYFVIDNLDQLYHSIAEIEHFVEETLLD